MNAPRNCSVIAVGRDGLPQSAARFKSRSFDGKNDHFFLTFITSKFHLQCTNSEPEITDSSIFSSSTWSRRFPPLQKLLRSNSARKPAQSTGEATEDKSSPRAVLDGPEAGEQHVTEECYSTTSSNEVSRRGQNGIWRRLSDMKLWLPFLRSIDDENVKGGDNSSNYTEDQKLAWRCFSYQEISVATNDFHPGKYFHHLTMHF